MTFEEYMRECLYHPQFGYYMQGRERTGIGGDFFSSCDLHPIFARLVARQAAEMWEILGRPGKFTWVETGAGRGWFAHDFLDWVAESRPDFYVVVKYVAIEPALQQRERVLQRVGARFRESTIRTIASLEELEPITGCFFSNEVVDAFPVHIVTRLGGRLREIYVTGRGGELGEEPGPISDPAVAAFVARYARNLEEGQRVEVGLRVTDWMRAIRKKLACGFVLTVDYGDLADRL
jgi:SAM-dependent MidA family methyltransferase